MITALDLFELSQELADSRVLSVYLDTRLNDPALRFTGRAALAAALRAARGEIDDEADRALFDRAAAEVYGELPPPDDLWGAPGWVAFITADGVRHVGWLPVRPTSIATWRDGPVIAPYLRALKQQRAVIVALVGSRSARLYRYVSGRLESLETIEPDADEPSADERAASSPRVGRSVPAPRGAVATEAAERRRRSTFQRLASRLTVRLEQLAGADGWILIGGARAWSRAASDALPPRLRERTQLSSTLGHSPSESSIAREAKRAASAMRATHGQRLLADLLESAGAQARAALGLRSVERALAMHAVELLLLSPTFISDATLDAERLVRAALAGGTAIDVLSGDAADDLDRTAGGIGARLRFAIGASAIVPAPLDFLAGLGGESARLDNSPYKDYPSREENDATFPFSIGREGTHAGSTQTHVAIRDR